MHERKFSADQQVEVNYRGKGRWYGGTISRVSEEGKYDIAFDDGEVDYGINEELIRTPKEFPKFQVGTKVDANYRGKGRWFPGVIGSIAQDGSYTITYDDGEEESGVKGTFIRRENADILFEIGMRVEVNYQSEGLWYPAVIVSDNGDTTFGVKYENDVAEKGVATELIREIGGLVPSDLKVGLHVEVNYQGKGRWYSGVVARDCDNGTYDVNYDDGETEKGVSLSLFRLLVNETTTAVGTSLAEGMRVEANYRGNGTWFPGKIITKNDGMIDTFNVRYDDEEIEEDIPGNLIREIGSLIPSDLKTGLKVEANYLGRGRWYPGVVSLDCGQGKFDVVYDDGEREHQIPYTLFRLLGVDGERVKPLSKGMAVSVNYLGRGMYYPGKVAVVNENGTYDIDYDDYEKESNVSPLLIRLHQTTAFSKVNDVDTSLLSEGSVEGLEKRKTSHAEKSLATHVVKPILEAAKSSAKLINSPKNKASDDNTMNTATIGELTGKPDRFMEMSLPSNSELMFTDNSLSGGGSVKLPSSPSM